MITIWKNSKTRQIVWNSVDVHFFFFFFLKTFGKKKSKLTNETSPRSVWIGRRYCYFIYARTVSRRDVRAFFRQIAKILRLKLSCVDITSPVPSVYCRTTGSVALYTFGERRNPRVGRAHAPRSDGTRIKTKRSRGGRNNVLRPRDCDVAIKHDMCVCVCVCSLFRLIGWIYIRRRRNCNETTRSYTDKAHWGTPPPLQQTVRCR